MLSATAINNAKPKDKPYKIADEKGLYLFIQATGSKLWRFDYRFLVENNANNGKAEVSGVRLMGETLASDWLKDVMTTGEFSPELSRWVLAPLSTPPAGQRTRGKIVCSCLDVAENDIIDTIGLGADLITLQNKLKCGTVCGSCVPELKSLIKQYGKLHKIN